MQRQPVRVRVGVGVRVRVRVGVRVRVRVRVRDPYPYAQPSESLQSDGYIGRSSKRGGWRRGGRLGSSSYA